MAEELTAAQQEELLGDLRSLQSELRKSLQSVTEQAAVVELDQAAVGRLSRMDAIQQQKMAQAQRRRALVRLERVEGLLEAFDDPDVDFGCCRTCGDPIAFARLKARPDALFCVACAQAREAR